jgi:ATP phosphoribosyltransferase regulatory subunit
VFSAYTPGYGKAVARGGRYDDVGQVFGRARPATGFSADLKTLASLGRSTGEGLPGAVFAPRSDDPALAALVGELRRRGEVVICELSGQSGNARDMGCKRVLVERESGWVLEPLSGDRPAPDPSGRGERENG